MTIKVKKHLTILALVLMSVTASAQKKSALQNSTPEQRAKMQTDWMKTKLNLSSGQTEQVQALNLQYAQKNAPVLQSDDSKLAKFKKLKASQKEKDEALSKILDAGQFKKYQEMKEEMLKTLKEKRK